MADSTGSLNCIYASAGGNSWKDASYFYSGKSGTWYRTKVVVTTGSFTGQSSCLKISININGTSSPCGCWGVLTTNGSLATGKVMNDSLTGPHSDLTTGCIAQSCSYSNRACTTEETGTNKSSGYVVYYKFASTSLQPNTTYYAYFCYKSGRGSGSGWTQSNESRMSTWVEYTPHYSIDVNMYTDSTWHYSGDGVNKFHADVGGTRRATNASDFGYSAAAGTSYTITPVAATGYTYEGTTTNSGYQAASGTYPSSNFSVGLIFNKNYVKIAYSPNGAAVTGSGYSVDQWGWIKNSGGNAFHKIYYGTNANPYDASTFGLLRPGYSFNQWNLNGTSTNLNQSTDYASTVYANGSSTTANSTNFYTHLYANWNPNNYTISLNANGGSISSSSTSLTYGNSAYTGLPTPTRTGHTFKGWYANITANGPIQLGLDYRYTDALNVGFDAYKADWTNWNASEAFISCTNSGGWNLFAHSGLMGSDVWDAGAGAYKGTYEMYDLKTLSPGWHHFDMVFGNSKMYYYIDGVEIKTSATFSGNIGLNRNSCLWLGAEAGGGEAHDGACVFNGLLKNVRILNSTWADYPASVFPIPAQNTTLYADWEANNYTVTYNANGGSGSMSSSPATYGQPFITRQCIFTRASHKFIGWNEKADGSGTWWYLNSNGVYESGNTWTWTYTSNITLYAQWELTTIYVSVYNRDGSQLIGTLSGDAGTSITIPYSWSNIVEEELDAGTAQWYDNDSLVDETLYNRKETYAWDGTYFDINNEDTYASTFTLPQHNLELWAQYSPTGDRKIILQAPPSPRVQETEICKGWGRKTYVEVTPGSWIEFEDEGSTPIFSAFFQPQVLTHQIYKQDDGRYYYGTTLAKIRNKWQNVNSTFVKYDGHWMTLKQFISDYGDLSLLDL